jgi:hypothetical protein
MVELSSYLFPATQGFFCIIIGIVWLIGFFRHRNFGFILLGFVVLAEAVTALVRQGLINYVIYLQPNLSASERTTLFGTISMVLLGIYVFYWIVGGLGAVLIVFHRTESKSQAVQRPPISWGSPSILAYDFYLTPRSNGIQVDAGGVQAKKMVVPPDAKPPCNLSRG